MKLILSSCDFINDNSRKVINDNVDVTNSKVLFIPNEKATKELINSDKYYKRLYKDGFTENNIYIFDEENANQFINLDIDVIYIGGGNTFATLKKIKDCGFDKYIINYINNGVIYIGGSCGAHIVTKNIEHLLDLDNNYCNLDDYNGLGLLDGIIIPHFNEVDYEPEKRMKLYNKLITENKYKVYILTNSESIIVNNDKMEIINEK
ncbi:MAG: Type 1 glutamine amidotransferase-like domain-containing protein [Bacilli bacterium]|nr:Type 1 glutamine amidotransferase-like domain-containing protein [Bacilli bacterium]